MKFFAILRDSMREALDAKVIYVLFALSALVIVGVASLSFRPQPAQQGMESIVASFPGARTSGFGRGKAPLSYTVEKFQQLNDTSRPWEGDYRCELVVTENNPDQPSSSDEDEDKAKEKPKPKPKAARVSPFRLLVLADYIERNKDRLTEEDHKTLEKVTPLIVQLRQGGENMSSKQLRKLSEELSRELKKVRPDQMEGFIRAQLVAHATLDVGSVKLLKEDDDSYRFAVEAKGRPETYRSWPHTLVLFFGALPLQAETGLGPLVHGIEDKLVGSWGAGLAMLLSTIITAFFIPNMLRKGSVDLLITKPIPRWQLLLFKYVGGLSFMFVNTVVIVVGIWLVLGLRSGLWAPSFLLTIFVLTFQFAIFYAISTLVGVLTRSPIVSILAACAAWVILWAVGVAFVVLDATRDLKVFPRWAHNTVDAAHFVLPRYKDLDILTSHLIAKDLLGPESPERKTLDRLVERTHWGESIAFTVVFIGVIVGLACWRFSVKDY